MGNGCIFLFYEPCAHIWNSNELLCGVQYWLHPTGTSKTHLWHSIRLCRICNIQNGYRHLQNGNRLDKKQRLLLIKYRKKIPPRKTRGSSYAAISLYHWHPLNGVPIILPNAICYYLPVNGSFKSIVSCSAN